MSKKSKLEFQISINKSQLREGTAVSNIDGRLWGEVGANVGRYFGDEAMVRARVGVESRYLIALSEIGLIRKLYPKEKDTLLNLHKKLDSKSYQDLRKIEAEVRHDVMVMTMFMRKILANSKLSDIIDAGWIHWALTSEDVDNLSRSTLLKAFISDVYFAEATVFLENIIRLAEKTKNVIIPGKTHLQTAVPTTLGKEIALYGLRVSEQLVTLKRFRIRGKLTGAVGNIAAQKAAYPRINWRAFSKNFVESLGLEASIYTTQIEPRSNLVGLLQKIQIINSILIDLSQDMRLWIGMEYLAQEVKNVEFGSSAMPQKVNPIDFENTQGNALFSNWIIEGLVRLLPVSWLQRDLVDKTIMRNFGLVFGHALISLVSASKGINRVIPNAEKIEEELNRDWSIISEGLQTYLRSIGKADAYEMLKKLAHGRKLTERDVSAWVDRLKISSSEKRVIKNLTPKTYIGYAKENCEEMLNKIKRDVNFIRP